MVTGGNKTRQKGVNHMMSWQGAVLVIGFVYMCYLIGVFFNAVRQDVMESFAIWNEERKERV
tara:strand:- start:776 stop:961 length:186 start_codon:yes stop_codon:yes gene_type:complete